MTEVDREIRLALPSPRRLFTPAVTVIIVLLIIGFTLANYAADFGLKHLAISVSGILHGRIWQLITYSLINPGGCGLLFNGLVVLFIGSAIEREWRSVSFVALWAVVSVTCGIIWIIVNLVSGTKFIGWGTSACSYGFIGTFGLLFRHKRFLALIWTVEAQYLALFLIGAGIVLGIPRPITWIWVSGAGVAYIYIKLRWRLEAGGVGGTGRSAPGRPSGFVDID